MNFRIPISMLSIVLLAFPAPGAQVPAREQPLKIVVLDGDKAVNSIRDGRVTQPVIEVRDENERVLRGVDVTFQLPATGPGGSFGGSLSQTVKTNTQGQAAPTGYSPNDKAGQFTITVSAVLGERSGKASLSQRNTIEGQPMVERSGGGSGLWKILLIVGSAAGVGGALALRGGGGGSDNPGAPSGPPSISITPGAVSIGGPR